MFLSPGHGSGGQIHAKLESLVIPEEAANEAGAGCDADVDGLIRIGAVDLCILDPVEVVTYLFVCIYIYNM